MRKDLYYIKQLLNLYYGGFTTRGQERELMDYFRSGQESDIPADMRADRLVQVCRGADPKIVVPSALREQLSAHIDMLDRRERRGRRGRRLMVWASVAASLAILVTVGVFLIKESSVASYELTDPQEAQAEAQRALLLVSECLNKADSKVAETDMLLERLGFDLTLFEDEMDDSLMQDCNGTFSGEFTDTIGV
ncbi:hypothetical protein [uncultured Muribaculum sp.]|uniref:hypothetical protein n=1 Tax=uncultured Muribaculum sp. TaxID=1918613 RepID=UPI0025DB6F20|nr:hypothetical protein [uncultured Muribaculum sp.]